jgi:hypothetical protein
MAMYSNFKLIYLPMSKNDFIVASNSNSSRELFLTKVYSFPPLPPPVLFDTIIIIIVTKKIQLIFPVQSKSRVPTFGLAGT